VLERAEAAGIERILVPGFDLASSHAALVLAAARPELIQPAVGVHPHHAASMTEAAWAELEALAAESAVVAVGEIGLDFHRNLSPPDAQRDAFARQLALAARLRRPVLVHNREAHEEITSTLLAWEGPSRSVRGVLHAYSGDEEMAERFAAVGFLVSFALPLAFRSATGPRAAAAALPSGSLLVETDAPWLAPGGANARNEPTTALRVAAELARLRSDEVEGVVAQVRQAYERLVAPPPTASADDGGEPVVPAPATAIDAPAVVVQPPQAEAPASPRRFVFGLLAGIAVAVAVIGVVVWLLVLQSGA
jgi:TatD DNase family protein